MRQRVLFIVNPAAGASRAHQRWPRIEQDLGAAGVHGEKVFASRPGEAMELAKARASEFELIIAAGGDGTAFEVASGILSSPGSGPIFSVLPLGTGNDFACSIGVGDVKRAQAALAKGKTQRVDTIRIDCVRDNRAVSSHALLFAGVGIVGESLKRTTGLVKRVFGQRLAYPAGIIRALVSYRSPHMKVALDQHECEGGYLLVCASNTELAGGGMKLAPGARMDDGLLNVNRIQQVGRFQALRQLWHLCKGRHIGYPNVDYRTAAEVSVETDPPIEVAADGELVGYTPARFRVQPAALQVIVP